MKKQKRDYVASVNTSQNYSRYENQAIYVGNERPSLEHVHYRFEVDGFIELLCHPGYFPNCRVSKDELKITCPKCLLILLQEAQPKDEKVVIH